MVSEKRLRKLANAEYRQEFLRSALTSWVVAQLRALRRQRGWTQSDLAERAGIPQSGIARAESEDYGSWSTKTLVALANAFDVALEIRFVPWPEYMRRIGSISPENMEVSSFSEDEFDVQVTTYQRPWRPFDGHLETCAIIGSDDQKGPGRVGASLDEVYGSRDVLRRYSGRS